MNKTPNPSTMQTDVEIEADFDTEFDDHQPTVIDRRCPGCAGEFLVLDNDEQPPASHAEFWRASTICRGTRDPSGWWACQGPFERRGEGKLELPGRMEVHFFPDRRLSPRPVIEERRRAPLPPPFPPRRNRSEP